MASSESPSSDRPDEPVAWHPLIERLLVALPELREIAEEEYGGWAEHASFLVYGGVLGRHLDALLDDESMAERGDDARRAFSFLEDLATDGREAMARGEDRHLYDLAIEAMDWIASDHLGRAYPLMGPSTRAILDEMAAWNEFAYEQAQVKPDRRYVEHTQAFREAYRRAMGDLPQPDRPDGST